MVNRKYGWVGPPPRNWNEPGYKMTRPTDVTFVDRMSIWRSPRDQGQEGACTGAGGSGVIETALGIRHYLSMQFPYFNARVREATQDSDSGAMIGDMLAGVAEYGICTEEVYPYVVGEFSTRPTLDAYVDAVNLKGKIKQLRVQGSLQLRHALASGSPVVFGFSVPDYFESDQVARNGLVRLPTSADQFLGGHCVFADGFDARGDRPFVWCVNSWGKHWGVDGWFKMDMAWFDDRRMLVDEAYAISPA